MNAPAIVDARGMEPPVPFEMAMEAVADLAPGQTVTLLLDRMPTPLFRILDRDGYRYTPTVRDDAVVEVLIERP
jgi:TusA-related sulfurtransferase